VRAWRGFIGWIEDGWGCAVAERLEIGSTDYV
jgi:hypothetical protein